jgi:hypothetical protein
LSKRILIICSDVDHSASIIRFDVGFPGFGLAKTFGQGRPMSLYILLARKASSFSLFSDSMLQDESLPLADVMDGGLFKQALKEFDVDFGSDDNAVYTPTLMLWALVSQAFSRQSSAVLPPQSLESLLGGRLEAGPSVIPTPVPIVAPE